ncbi:MAG: hypothetical protein GEV09_06085 [Pseudonocardiaceae bacterium]|nr:hypothetical protein [Pseudonocardiaceae bacterium]
MRHRGTAQLTALKHAMFERHSNPWSAWTRWLSTPLILVPFWTRRWSHAAPVAAWMLVNPIVFRKPASDEAWATRAVLGEEMWIGQRPRDLAAVVNVAATVCAAGAVFAARRRRLVPAAALTAVQMALVMGYWQLMAEYYDERRDVEPRS